MTASHLLPASLRLLSRRYAPGLSLTRIAGTSLALTLHVAAGLFMALPRADRDPVVVAQEVTMVVEFIPAQGSVPVLMPPPPPPPKLKVVRAPKAASVAPPVERGTDPLAALLTPEELATLDVPTPDSPPTEILSYRVSHQPTFPAESRIAGHSGWVTLRVLVDPEGFPTAFVLVANTATDQLVVAAIEAIKQWRFNPATKDGVPVPAWVEVPIGFYNSRTAAS